MANSPEIRRNSQALRKSMTKEERHLWYDFLKTYPIPIHRQYAFGNYIVDFYCHKAKLVIELDGSQHCTPEGIEYDQKRTDYLQSKGLYVVRVSNLDVMHQFRAVCDMLDAVIRERMH